MAAAMIIVGITTWIETVIETIAAEAIIIEDVMMTKNGGTKGCFKARNQ